MMALSRFTATLAVTALLGVFVALPAHAQFGSIFREEAPRPPADVPGQPEESPPASFPRPVNPQAPEAPPQSIEPQTTQPAPGAPGQPQTIVRPGQIQSQPLPPPPGASAAPLSPTGNQPENTTTAAKPGQPPLPGLPPGVRQPRGTPQPNNTAPQPGDIVIVEPPSKKIVNNTAVFTGLDKITGRTVTFDVAINETVQLGALRVTPRACYTRPPTETPNTDAFVAVDEITLKGEVRRIFTGWMFAASPGLHAVEHPIYDVWLVDCKNPVPAVAQTEPDAQPEPPAKPAQTPARQPPRKKR